VAQHAALRGLAFGILAALSASDAQAVEPAYSGSETCVVCHEDAAKHFDETLHARLFNDENALTPVMKLGCEACHGPGSEHVEAGGGPASGDFLAFKGASRTETARENVVCASCHKGGTHLYWEASTHDRRGLGCTSCHSSHEARSERHQLLARDELRTCQSCHLIQASRQQRRSRMPLREGHMECSSCHNAHGTANPSLIHQLSVNENCLSCHADKRGPFLWEHPPVTENCLSCHDPHGTSKRAMLRVDQPRLCQQCHVATRHPSEPRGAADRFVVGGACSNCHVNLHGSNHPAGFVFSR
jgi:DmsE family decaheme c-type cytochrome